MGIEMAEEDLIRPRRTVPLVAATLSFIYHLLLAILANYIPTDPHGAKTTLWVYSWTASIVCYFGLIAIVVRHRILSSAFAYLLFLDCLFSALWRFALLEYVIGNHFADLCRGPSGDGPRQSCGTPFGVVHVAVAFLLFVLTFSEVLLADAVRKFGRDSGEASSDDSGEGVPSPDIKFVEYPIGSKG